MSEEAVKAPGLPSDVGAHVEATHGNAAGHGLLFTPQVGAPRTGAVKVAFFLTSPRGGGAERAMIAVANYFAAEGVAVDVVFARPDGPYRGDVDPRIDVVDLGVSRLRHILAPMNAYMRRAKPRVVISAFPPCDTVMLIGNLLLRWNTRLIVSVQNHPLEVQRHARRPLDRMWPLLIRGLYPRAECVVGISVGVAETMAKLLGRSSASVPVINNPVIAPGFDEKLEEEPGHPWFHDGEAPVILAAGRLVRQKDYPTLFRAFARLLRRRDARLIVVGEGEERPALEELACNLGIAGRVAMPGFVSNPYCWMKRARLFALCSRWEGFANVVAEALACGTPVVATNCPSGPREILNDGEYGRLVPVGDEEAFARAMEDALDAPVDREKLVARGKAYSTDRIAPRYLSLVESVTAR